MKEIENRKIRKEENKEKNIKGPGEPLRPSKQSSPQPTRAFL
jgi:hypothetical protein